MKESIPSRVQPPQAAKKPLFWFAVSGTLCRANSRLELVIRGFLLGCSPRACGRASIHVSRLVAGSQRENWFPAAQDGPLANLLNVDQMLQVPPTPGEWRRRDEIAHLML